MPMVQVQPIRPMVSNGHPKFGVFDGMRRAATGAQGDVESVPQCAGSTPSNPSLNPRSTPVSTLPMNLTLLCCEQVLFIGSLPVAAAGCLPWRQLAAASLRLPPLEASAYRAGTSRGPDGPSRATLKVRSRPQPSNSPP
jgi:hypothetical protein